MLVMAACTTSTGATTTAAPAPETSTPGAVSTTVGETPEETIPPGTVAVIPFMTTENDPATLEVLQGIIGTFAETNPDILVDLVVVGHGEPGQRIATAAAVGGDLGILHVNPERLREFEDAGFLLPIDDLLTELGEDQFSPGTIYRGADGNAYALGLIGGVQGTLWVREDLLNAAGLEPPASYDELIVAAEVLTAGDVYGFGLQGGADKATDLRFYNFVYQNCADFFDWEGNLVFDRPEALLAVEKYVELYQYSPPGSEGWGFTDGLDAFAAGRLAMHPYGGRLGVNVDRIAPDIRANTSVIPLRTGEVQAANGGFAYTAIYAGSAFPDAAKRFLAHLYAPESLAALMNTVPGHLIPPTKAAQEAVLASDDPYVQAYPDDVRTMFEVGSRMGNPSVNMGAIDLDSCEFNPAPNPNPWAAEIFSGTPTLISEMIGRIVVDGESAEDAWRDTYTRMGEIADEYKAANPDWEPAPRQ
ncbi:MAG: extracellular solute-binding protein [Actinobacteria bacterium]|nr:extracellular solute-binding protein [Actinomycetota bacterium]